VTGAPPPTTAAFAATTGVGVSWCPESALSSAFVPVGSVAIKQRQPVFGI